MLIKSKAIVIKCVKYGEQKLIVDMYTEQLGRITTAVKISHSKKSKMRNMFFRPLTMLMIETDYRERMQMQRLNDVQMYMPWTSIQFDPMKMTVGMFLAEVLCYAVRQEQSDSMLFRFIEQSMQWLDTTEQNISNFHIVFLLHLTGILGFMPAHEDYTPHTIFDLRTGELAEHAPLHSDFLKETDTERMFQIMRITYANMHLFKMTRAERKRCLDTILYYYRLHLPAFPELKSLAVMNEIFD